MDWASIASFGKGAASGVTDGAVSLADGLWSLGKGGQAAEMLASAKAGQAVQLCKEASAAAKLVEVRSAETVNQAMIAVEKLPAWMPGTQVISEIVPAGTRFNMVVGEKQAERLMLGRPAFGAFATSERVPTQAFARDKLVILEQFKEDVSQVVTVETTAAQLINRGITGPLGSFAGGVQQVEFVGERALKLVGDSLLLPLK